jgi:glycosyltransferase involved in cell wall biosynthesis
MGEPHETELSGVSIVTANYNYGRFIGDTIRSALAQDHPKIEVIVVDDGSTDNSREVIESFGNAIRALFLPVNGGQTAAFSAALPLRHEIVIFLDSDDLLTPDAASIVARAWRPGLSKVQWCLSVIDADGRPLDHVFPKYPSRIEPKRLRRELLRVGFYPCPPTSGNAYARSFLQAIAPFRAPRNAADVILNRAAPLHGDVLTIKRPMTSYRRHGSNMYGYGVLSLENLKKLLVIYEENLRCFQSYCARAGVAFDPDCARRRDYWYHQYCLARATLASPSCRRTARARILLQLLSALARAPEPEWQKLAIGTWATLVAVLPRAWAIPALSLRLAPTRRPRWIRRIAETSGRRRAGITLG